MRPADPRSWLSRLLAWKGEGAPPPSRLLRGRGDIAITRFLCLGPSTIRLALRPRRGGVNVRGRVGDERIRGFVRDEDLEPLIRSLSLDPERREDVDEAKIGVPELPDLGSEGFISLSLEAGRTRFGWPVGTPPPDLSASLRAVLDLIARSREER